MAEECPAFGVGFDVEDEDCKNCKKVFPNDYVACGEKVGEETAETETSEETEVSPEDELDLVAAEHEAEAEQGDEIESPDEVPDEMEEPDDAAIETIEAETSVKRGRPPMRQMAFINVLLTGEPRTLSGIVDSMSQDAPSVSAKGNKPAAVQWLRLLVGIGVVTETDEGFVLDSEYVR